MLVKYHVCNTLHLQLSRLPVNALVGLALMCMLLHTHCGQCCYRLILLRAA